MGWLTRKPDPVAVAEAEAAAAVADLAGTPYTGEKKPIFREGFYYLCHVDADGNEGDPDTTVPLLWDHDQNSFVYARDTDPNHFHRYGLAALELEPGSED